MFIELFEENGDLMRSTGYCINESHIIRISISCPTNKLLYRNGITETATAFYFATIDTDPLRGYYVTKEDAIKLTGKALDEMH